MDCVALRAALLYDSVAGELGRYAADTLRVSSRQQRRLVRIAKYTFPVTRLE